MDSSVGASPLPSQPRFAAQIPPPPFSSSHLSGGGSHHRRAHSETFLRLPDDFLFDPDPDFGISDLDLPSFSDENLSGGDSAASAAGGGESSSAASAAAAGEARRSDLPAPSPAPRPIAGAHLRSLSVDAVLFEGLSLQVPLAASSGGGGAPPPERKGLHRRSGSMDGSSSSFEGDSAQSFLDYAKKAMTDDKLAELALIDPKRAKRILANRQSAARSKERKIRYTGELERKVQTLQTEATTLSAQLTLLQRDTTGLTAENRELKLRLQALEQQAQLRDALNEALREEVQRLRIATGQIPNVNSNPSNIGFQHSASSYSQQLPHRSGLQARHQHPSRARSSSNSSTMNDHDLNDSMDLM